MGLKASDVNGYFVDKGREGPESDAGSNPAQ
jgi:hypothetical protein